MNSVLHPEMYKRRPTGLMPRQSGACLLQHQLGHCRVCRRATASSQHDSAKGLQQLICSMSEA